MNTQNVWVKRSEREPSASDFPCRVGFYSTATQDWYEYTSCSLDDIGTYTHWRSIKCDPPARELTQRERDDVAANAASNEAYRLDADKPEAISINSARRAIYAERREVANLMRAWAMGDANWGTPGRDWPEKMQAVRARLDEQGAE